MLNWQKTVKNKSITREMSKIERVHWHSHPPVVIPGIQSSKDIKLATNFRSEKEMLAFIIVVCNGDWERMTDSVTGVMKWFEE